MRATVVSLSRKLLSTVFAATLAFGLVPATAFAAEDPQVESDQNIESTEQDESNPRVISTEDPQGHDPRVISTEDLQGPSGEISSQDEYANEDSTSVIPAENVINQTMPLETVAQQESTRSYFLAQTLESTRTIPMVSANLPLDEGTVEEVVESDGEGAPEEEAGEDSDESDLAPAPIASESTVIGSFTSRGLTYAVEPGGETVALVAADYHQLPTEFVDAQTVVIPAAVTPDNIDYYSVTRIADYAFAGNGNPADITTLTIPESVSVIDPDAFTDFQTLQYLVVSDENIAYSSFDGALYDADQNRLLLIPEGRLGAVRVAPSVTEVDPEAFSHCPSVTPFVADANSAAYQLLSENDLDNANGGTLEVVTTEDAAEVQSLWAVDYEEIVSTLGGLDFIQPSGVPSTATEARLETYAAATLPPTGWNLIAEVYASTYEKAGKEVKDCKTLSLGSGMMHMAYPGNSVVDGRGQWRDLGYFIPSQSDERMNFYTFNTYPEPIGPYQGFGSVRGLSGMASKPNTLKIGFSPLTGLTAYMEAQPGVAGWSNYVEHLATSHAGTPRLTYTSSIKVYERTAGQAHYADIAKEWGTTDPPEDTYSTNQRYLILHEGGFSYTLNPNGGTSDSLSGSHVGSFVPSLNAYPGKTLIGFTLANQASAEASSGVDAYGFYAPDASFFLKADTTVIAQWGASINWVTNGGNTVDPWYVLVGTGHASDTTPTAISTAPQFAANNSALPTPVRQGWAFDGWYLGTSATACDYLTPLAADTLVSTNTYAHAKWKATASWNATRSADVVADTYAYSPEASSSAVATFEAPAAPEAPAGYAFAGWATTEKWQANETLVQPGETIANHLLTNEAKAGNPTFYARWKYRAVLNLNTTDALGNMHLTDDGTKYEASLPANFAVITGTVPVEGNNVEVYAFDVTDGAPVTLPASVTRTGYAAATQWKTAEGTTYTGTIPAPFEPELVSTSATNAYGSDGERKAFVLFAHWAGKARTYDVTLTSDYTQGSVTFKAQGGHTTKIKARYDAPLLKVENGKVVAYADGTEVKAPWILNTDGTYAYAFAGYYDQMNTLDTANGTCWMGSTPVTGASGYEGAAVVPTDVVYRTAGNSGLFARWTRVESGLTLDPQGGTFAGSTSPVKVEGFVLTANQEVDHLKAPYNAVPTRTGYRFAGWWSASTKTSSAAYATYAQDETTKRYFEAPTPTSTTVVSTGLMWPYYTDTTLYAHWEYDLTFAANAGSDTASFSFTASGQGAPSSGTMPTLTPEGGAYKDAFGNLYHFEGADQGSAIASITVLDGTPVALPTYGERLRAGERAGYSLAGFYATSACTGEALTSTTLSGNVVPVGGSAVVYADWTALTYTVSLKAKAYDGFAYGDLTQDMSVTPAATVTATYDSPLPATDDIVPEMRGYSFLGWFDAPQEDAELGQTDRPNYSVYGATKFYDRSGPVSTARWTKTATEDLVLYAHYRQIPYTLTFELGTGETLSGVDNPLDVFYGYSLAGVTAKPYLDGYDFAGWKVKDTSETSPLFSATGQGRGLYLTEGNTTLVPSWSGKTYKITWMLDYAVDDDFAYDHCAAVGLKGGLVVDDTVLYNRPVAIPDAAAYEAYGFHGWFTDKDAALDRVASKNALDLYFERQADGAYVFKPRNDQDVSELVFFASWGSDTDPFSPVTYTVSVYPGERSSFASDTVTVFHRSYGDAEGPVVLPDFVDELTSRAHAGWAFAGWMETTGGMDEPYDDTTVPLGTGDRAFTAQWEPDKRLDYTIAFQKGRSEINSRSTYPYDYVTMERDGAVLSDKRAISFDASVTGFTLPCFTQGEDTVTETLGFTFKGWFRADADWNVAEDEPLAKSVYDGQELADIAKGAGTTALKYVAVWEPKDFTVLYQYSTEDATLMDTGSYDSAPVPYLDKVTLASPSYERDRAAIFDRWEGATSILSDPLVPGRANLSIAELVRKATDARVDRSANTVTLTGIWTEAYSFTVPLTVNIAIDPERAEGTVKGQGYISTSATRELKVASVTFTRDENLSDTLFAKGADRTQGDVYLAIEGDDAASPLLVDLSQGADPVYTKEHDAFADHGLTSVRAANANTPATLGVTYDLVIREGADVTFADFTKLLENKDIRDEHKNLASTSIGRVMYTLTLR